MVEFTAFCPFTYEALTMFQTQAHLMKEDMITLFNSDNWLIFGSLWPFVTLLINLLKSFINRGKWLLRNIMLQALSLLFLRDNLILIGSLGIKTFLRIAHIRSFRILINFSNSTSNRFFLEGLMTQTERLPLGVWVTPTIHRSTSGCQREEIHILEL